MFEVNLFQWWIVLGVAFASASWRVISYLWIKGLDQYYKSDFLELCPFLKPTKSSWLWWGARFTALYLLLSFYFKNPTYGSIGNTLALFTVLNLMRGLYVLSRQKEGGEIREETPTKSVQEGWIVSSLISCFIFGLFSFLAGSEAEKALVDQACTVTTKTNEVESKWILPSQTIQVQRDGNTWWQIYCENEPGRVYLIKESPAWNHVLNAFAGKSRSGSPDRFDLLRLTLKENQAGAANVLVGSNLTSYVATPAPNVLSASELKSAAPN